MSATMVFYRFKDENESYSDAIKRLTFEDSNAFGQKPIQIAARIKNSVVMASDINISPGSDMFILSSYMAHSLAAAYKEVMNMKASDASKMEMANALKDIEASPAKFAEAVKIRRTEEAKKKAKQENIVHEKA